MNILFCGDGNIAGGVMISVLSLMDVVKEPLHIYLLTASVNEGNAYYEALPERFAEFLDRKVKAYHPKGSARLFDITGLFAAQPPTANLATRFTPCCMLRLYADLVEELPERLLYLDNDVICRMDPSELYHMDMQGAELAGALDYYGSWFFRKNLFKRDYLNSGVLLLDMKKIRETGLFSKCRQRCRDMEMFMPDQSAINKLASRKLVVSRRFNEQRRLKGNTVFQHFTTSFRFFPWFHMVSVKPWDVQGLHNTLKLTQYDDLLDRFRRLRSEYEEI